MRRLAQADLSDLQHERDGLCAQLGALRECARRAGTQLLAATEPGC